MPKTRVLLIRHGQTKWNREGRFRGQMDMPLDAAGRAQAEATGQRIASHWKVDAVFAGPLSRTVETAQAITQHFGQQVQIVPGLIDIHAGEWQGLRHEEALRRWPDLVEQWFTNPEGVRPPGGETLSEVRARALVTVQELADSHPGQTIALVSHESVIREILLGALHASSERFWHLGQDNCAINVLDYADGDFVVVKVNDTDHLEGSN